MLRKYVDYLTYTITLNEFKLSERVVAINKTFLKITPRPWFLVGKLCLGGISKFNYIPLLRSWELNRNLYIKNDARIVSSGSVQILYFCQFSLE